MITSVIFRGQEHDVEYRDHGWDPDTNAHEIGWAFLDDKLNQTVVLTEEEEESIYQQLAERSFEAEG